MIIPKNLIADFYMYEYLVSSEETYDKDLELDIKYGALVYLDKLKDYLITVLEYSIIREISHVWWETIQPNTMISPTKKYMESVINEDIFYIIMDLAPEWVNTLKADEYVGEELKGCSRLKQYMFIKHHPDIDVTTFISKFKKCFTKLAWINDHGGENWVSITNSYLKLKETKGEDLFIVCDTIFWLQHNTNTVFNKIKAWEQNGSYKWINEFLDFRKECDLWDLLEHCDESKKLAAKKLKLQFNTTKEEFDKEELVMDISVGKVEPITMPTMEDIAEYTNKPVFESMESIKVMLIEEMSKIENKFDPLHDELAKHLTMINSILNQLTSISATTVSTMNKLTDIHNDLNTSMIEVKNGNDKICLSIEQLGERISTYRESVHKLREQVYKDMEQLYKTVSITQKNYVDQTIEKITEQFEKDLEERTNAILERLEQRWYKRLWKWISNWS